MRTGIAGTMVVIALTAAACGSSGDSGDGVSSEAGEPAAEEEAEGAVADDAAPEDPAPDEPTPAETADPASLSAVAGDGWELRLIGEGTKPDLALDPDGVAGITFLFEKLPEGFVAYATEADGWTVDRFVEGYFYGPIGLDYGPDGGAHIAYHDHQAATFQDQLGDLTHAVLTSTGWETAAARSEGHDGWDSTIRVGDDGIVRAAGIDPAQFGRVEGLEYYELVDGEWQVEEVGTGPLEYEWNVDLQVAPDNTSAITYFATEEQDLMFATRDAAGGWTTEAVDTEGDVGRFSSFAFDSAGSAHISYWHADTGEVRYATNTGGTWEITPVDTLANVQLGFEAARRVTSIALDGADAPQIAYSDVDGVWLATLGDDGAWTPQRVLTAGARPLGQLVSLEVEAAGQPHIAFYEVTANGPLAGLVGYLTPVG